MFKYKNMYVKKIGLLICSSLAICTFITAKAAINEEYIPTENNSINLVIGHENIFKEDMLLINNDILIQQNTEGMCERNISIINLKKIKGPVIKKRNKIELTKKEKNIMYRIVEAEAGGEDAVGKMLVANVIINRYHHNSFPDSIEKIVFAHNKKTYQFSPVADGRYYGVNVSRHTKNAVDKALEGYDNSGGALYFMSRNKADKDNVTWFDKSLDYVLKYGCHEFFR